MIKTSYANYPIRLALLLSLMALLVVAGCSNQNSITNSPDVLSGESGDVAGVSPSGGTTTDPGMVSGYNYGDVEGYVEMIDYENMKLKVMGEYYYANDYTMISIDDCYLPYPTFYEIRNGDYVKIKYHSEMGGMDYYASEIQVVRSFDYYSVEGYVTMVDYEGSRIQVMDQYYWVDGCTGFDIDDCYAEYPSLSELYEGDYVKIEYRSEMDDNGYYARKVQVTRSFDYYETLGYVQSIDYGNGTLVVMDQTYRVDGCTGIDFENFGYGSFDQIYVGDYVKIEYHGEMGDMEYRAKLIVVEQDYDYYEVMGYIEMIDYHNMSLMVMGEYYTVDGFTQIDISGCYQDYPTLNELYEGDYVKIEYRKDMDGNKYARKIQVENDYEYYDVMGTVEAVDYDNMTVMVMGQYYWLDACTELDLAHYNYGDFSKIVVGNYIKIEYRTEMDDMGYYARKIQLLYETHQSVF